MEISIGFDFVLGVFHNTLHIVGESVRAKSSDDMVSTFSVKQMKDVGKGKVRFVAVWAVNRVLQNAKKYVRDNLYTASSATRSQVNKCLHKIELIEALSRFPMEFYVLKQSTLEHSNWQSHDNTELMD